MNIRTSMALDAEIENVKNNIILCITHLIVTVDKNSLRINYRQ